MAPAGGIQMNMLLWELVMEEEVILKMLVVLKQVEELAAVGYLGRYEAQIPRVVCCY